MSALKLPLPAIGLFRNLDAKPATDEQAHRPFDPVLFAVVTALLGLGLVMVYSASAVEGAIKHHDPQFFLVRQAVYVVAGLGVMLLTSKIDYHRLHKLTYPVLGAAVVMLVVVLTRVGHAAGGAARWISIGPVHVQPAEFTKLALVLWLAYSLAKKGEQVRGFSVGFVPHVIVAGVLVALCMKQPDFGSAIVVAFLTFALLFVAGARLGYITAAGIIGGVLAFIALRYKEYRWNRLMAWLDLEHHRGDTGYQAYQSLIAIGSGERTGLGLGHGYQTLYLPEAHTDFIGAVIGEELGFVGMATLVALYVTLFVRGLRAAFRAPDDYGTFVAYGISALFAFQTIFNLSVILALAPTKGLTLPFVSFGGSSLLVCCAAAGIVLNVSRQGSDEPPRGEAPEPAGAARGANLRPQGGRRGARG
jgi:cell division protein FtsW